MSTITTNWIISAVVLLIFLMLVGAAARRHALGVLIDSRNRMSLSRLQLTLWTVVILSAFLAIAFNELTLDIYLSPEIWALMGITTGSTAGAVIVKGTKSGTEPAAAIVATYTGNRVGVLAVADAPRFSDMFMGEEVTDANVVDISKVQMFAFTVVLVAGYVVLLFNWDFTAHVEAADREYEAYLPIMSASMVTLLGISHAGYLTIKAAPK